jgi:hypothetical protein
VDALQVESSVRLLQLVSVVAEAAGERLQPHLGALAAALPQVNACILHRRLLLLFYLVRRLLTQLAMHLPML